MARAIKSLLALVVVVVAIIGVAVYLSKDSAGPAGQADSTASEKKPEPKLRVEEKYGFTTEGVGGG